MITVRTATEGDVRAVASMLREEDRREITCLGFDVIPELVACYRRALFAKAAEVNGEIAALWGCGGNYLGLKGRPWLVTTPVAERIPVDFGLIYRREVREMRSMFPVLENYAAASYARALRMLRLAGFTVDDPQPFGPQKVPFCRFWMRR